MVITELEHFEGFSLLLNIGAMLKLSNIKMIQKRIDDIHTDDEEEDLISDLPRISSVENCSAFLNDDNRPTLKVEFLDTSNKAFTLYIIYIAENHKFDTVIED